MTRAERLPSLLIVEDDLGIQKQLKWALSDHYEVELASNRSDAMAIVRRVEPTVAILDLGLPPDPNGASEGLAILEEILSFRPMTKVIVSSGNGERRHALEAIRIGAYDFYPKPVDIDVLQLIAQRAVHVHALEAENKRLAEIQARGALPGVIAGSQAMLEVCRMVERVAPAEVRVLLTGESGTGKEVLARALHDGSERATRKFVAINCAAVPENLLESELFGHEKGAFTGAVKTTIGKFEQAHEGTLFLDEIGDMPMSLQSKLLRFLQEKVVERVGGRASIAVDVRVIAATNQDLDDAVANGTFRQDLYYRLDVFPIEVPPLRERADDVPMLVAYLVERYAKKAGKHLRHIDKATMRRLQAYDWPGNVRELQNVIERAVILCETDTFSVDESWLVRKPARPATPAAPLKGTLVEREKEIIEAALADSRGRVSGPSGAAARLGIPRQTLDSKIRTLRIDKYRFRAP